MIIRIKLHRHNRLTDPSRYLIRQLEDIDTLTARRFRQALSTVIQRQQRICKRLDALEQRPPGG